MSGAEQHDVVTDVSRSAALDHVAKGDMSGSSDEEACECVVCIADVRTTDGHIFQCSEGHLFCQSCYLLWKTEAGPNPPCPTCKTILQDRKDIRNRSLEKLRDKQLARKPQLRGAEMQAGIQVAPQVKDNFDATVSAAEPSVETAAEHRVTGNTGDLSKDDGQETRADRGKAKLRSSSDQRDRSRDRDRDRDRVHRDRDRDRRRASSEREHGKQGNDRRRSRSHERERRRESATGLHACV